MRFLLNPVGSLYGTLAKTRVALYERHILETVKLEKPVVSVGNLTMGGTGKTPMVDLILTKLENRNLKCCVLTRGYGRSEKSQLIINDQTTSREAGDEPLWLFKRHPKTKIAVGSNRVESAAAVHQTSKDVDVYVLDDGLQHLQIKRDYEITLVDATRPLWHYEPFPRGYAREGFSALKRSDLVIITRANQAEPEHVEHLYNLASDQGVIDIVECSILLDTCEELQSGKNMSLVGKKAYLVSGIGHPESFERLVKDEGVEILGHAANRDHFEYTTEALEGFIRNAQALKADLILITEKDAIKWKEIYKESLSAINVGVVKTQFSFQPDLPDIYDLATHFFS